MVEVDSARETTAEASPAAEETQAPAPSGSFAKRLFAALGSFGTTVVILMLLTLLTWLGTLNQVEDGLYESQKKYFDSWVLVQGFGPLGIPLPGGVTLMVLLTINLLIGGITRILLPYIRGLRAGRLSAAKAWSTPFLILAHIGILQLLAAGLVKFNWSREGHLRIWPDEVKQEFESWHEWEIEISEPISGGRYRQYIIPHELFAHLEPKDSRKFTSEGLPFDLTIFAYARNTWPVADGSDGPHGSNGRNRGRAIDGWRLEARKPHTEAEANVAGCYAVITEKGSRRQQELLLWGGRVNAEAMIIEASYPVTFDVGSNHSGKSTWGIRLRHRTWQLPFKLRLQEFRRTLHPGTARAKSFESDVVVIDEANPKGRPVNISMNRPLRYGEHILFQSNWGPQTKGHRGRLFSDFSVVDNPSDQWPTWACFIIGIGLFFYLGVRLILYVRSERKKVRGKAVT